MSGSPEIYWVVGEGSDVGKTTIAAALIAFLNAEGERAIGFKPFAASLLHENIDFMFENYPGVPSKLFGRDAWHLAKASPLTDADWIDLVVPTQLLCYPNWRSAILMRSGSASLNNVEYFCSERGRALRDRRDFRQIRERAGIPFDQASVKANLDFDYAASVTPEKAKQAFQRLLGIGVDTVVCEGTGGWLPIWQDCPEVNHVLHLSDGMVRFFPDVDLSFAFQAEGAARRVEELARIVSEANPRGLSIPLYLAEQRRREVVAGKIVRELLEGVRRSWHLERSAQSIS